MGSRFGERSRIMGRAIVRDARASDLQTLLEIYDDAVLMSPAAFDLQLQTLRQRRKWFS
jgi:L-amino acid N-acyltransferase YncA